MDNDNSMVDLKEIVIVSNIYEETFIEDLENKEVLKIVKLHIHVIVDHLETKDYVKRFVQIEVIVDDRNRININLT